ncbi:putative Methylase involved in ubiquinone/menaquinone biosynthesis [Thiomonas sp. X19]|nr:putative Methylase involved in ubiquinone/menaquinone biosynthesis [Thiomonas sp. X19]
MDEIEIKEREKKFHDERFGQNVDPRSKLEIFYSITSASDLCFKGLVKKGFPFEGKILEYGCGTGGDFNLYKSLNCRLYGIDISDEAITKAQNRAEIDKIKAFYVAGDAEATKYESQYFDRVVGLGILHHLNLNRSLAELARITTPEGSCIFSEPLGHNPIINVFRKLTPKLRTPDEHPLRDVDFILMKNYFNQVNINYFYLISLLSFAFKKTRFFDAVYKSLVSLDDKIFKIFPGMGKYAWICIIELKSPKITNGSEIANNSPIKAE